MSETFLIILALLPAVAAAILPHVYRLIVIPAGLLSAYLFLFVLPAGGADNPLPFLAAGVGVGASIGAIVREVAGFIWSRLRVRSAS